jgi:hypothetical protein
MDARLIHDVIAELERQRGDLDALIAKLRAECEVAGDRPLAAVGDLPSREGARSETDRIAHGLGSRHHTSADVFGLVIADRLAEHGREPG